MTLTMRHFLEVVAEHGPGAAREVLLAEGYHWKVIVRKAEKASGKGYTNYGVAADRCWIEDRGREYLAAG